MQKSTAKRRISASAPLAAIALKPTGMREDQTRLGFALVVFMRVTAVIWIIQGLLQWGAFLSSGPDGASSFTALAGPAMVAALFFAVVDFVASVGLWLAAPWGGVIWLVAVGAQLLVLVVMPGFFEHPVGVGILDLGLMAGYLVLVWFSAQATDTVA
jgi:hypothetical protein